VQNSFLQTFLNSEKVDNEKTTKSSMSIIDILNKAHSSYQTKVPDQSKSDQSYISEQPKNIIGWPNDYLLDKNNYLKPEPIRIGTSITKLTDLNQDTDANNSSHADKFSTNESNNSSNKKLSLFQRLVSASEKNEPSCDLLSLDLKKKLNILKIPQSFQDAEKYDTKLTQVNSFDTRNEPYLNATSHSELHSENPKLMTVKDFEENLLNESCKLFAFSIIFHQK